ncbi:uncharacterized protein LOC110737997 isoform X1 [Chenopodium quinoa]|uniref:uncharacterized protein LOC110737997 isoform X1 n=1 Tax=Chenopodium quinoa TaxID=63459 RepID=UPI000B77CCAB|nr:uncharacterized protein LOC110737997 isoform X1 [Chenopodium quinoa]
MLDGIFRSNFRTKCKSLLSRTKTRLEVIKKRRNAMQRFLKKDIAELLKSNLDRNAYGRKTGVIAFLWSRLEWANVLSMAEGLYVELNLSLCYGYVEQCCTCIIENLKEMHRQSECPEECRVAVASLIHAAARFSDLPELRELRNLFYDKYGKALEPFTSKEFTENLLSRPPSTQMKLQLMQEIAQEFSVPWDPVQLEQQLQSSSLPTQAKPAKTASVNGASDGQTLFRNKSTTDLVKGKQVDGVKQNNEEQTLPVKSRRRNSCTGLKENIAEESQEENSMQEEKIPNNAYRKPFTNRIIPAPYIKSSNNTDEDNNQKNEVDDLIGKTKARPRSVRTKFLKPSTSTASTTRNAEHEIDPRGSLSARVTDSRRYDLDLDDDDEEEEAKLDKFLTQFGKKKVPDSAPAALRKEDSGTPKSELPLPPGRRRYFSSEPDQPASPKIKEANDSQRKPDKSISLPPDQQQSESLKTSIRHVRSSSYVNDGHVHPRMPEFDDLAERIAVLKNVQGDFEL